MTKIKDKDSELVNHLIFSQNTGRIPLFVLIAVTANILHIIFFFVNLGEPGTNEYIWRLGVISGHALIAIASIALGVSVYMHKRYAMPRKNGINIIFYVFLLLIVIAGVSIVTFDQLVTAAITPLIVLCIALAVVFVLKPQQALFLFLVTFILFFFAVSITQDNPEILLSIRVNGLTICFLGFLLSWIIWRNVNENHKQKIIIEQQSKDLEARNKQLTDQSAKLEIAISSRDRFMSVISHDLKSPFNSLLGFSEILIEEWEDLADEEKLQIVRLIKETSETTYQMLLNLLDWSRLHKERLMVQPKYLVIKELTENVLSQLYAQSSLKGIQIVLNIEEGLTVRVDEHMITSVVRNLLSNAIKFSSKDTVVKIDARMEQDNMFFCVEDSGVGLSEKLAASIFTEQVTTNDSGHETGTGLGLKLCSEFVQAHHGRIWVDSEPGKGARFCFTIPPQQDIQ